MSSIWQRAREKAERRFSDEDGEELHDELPASMLHRAETEAAKRWDARPRTWADADRSARARIATGQ